MFIGIDVGGTTTDAVLTEGTRVMASATTPTTTNDLSGCLLRALDELLAGTSSESITRIVLSTTVITNLLAEGKADPVGLLLIPGPGANPSDYRLPPCTIVEGAIDYRGREIHPLDDAQVRKAARDFRAQGLEKAVVVGKFCQRNHAHENRVERLFAEEAPGVEVELGHRVSGYLNFPRRAATTLLTLATRDRFEDFARFMQEALLARGLTAPIFVLKADGGTLPLDKSLRAPVETIFSGPAASVMGALALSPRERTSVVVDVGGTTTDLALLLSGRPLVSAKGARVDSLLTHVRAFAVKSVPVGGDSAVRVVGETVCVGPDRMGAAFCAGGPLPTPTDALRFLQKTNFGSPELAEQSMVGLASALGVSAGEAAVTVIEHVVGKITSEVDDMFAEWEQEPVYRIWELLQKEKTRPQVVVGVGGAAGPLVPLVAERLGAEAVVPAAAFVANAIGAAVARPTLTLSLSVDTEQGAYVVAEDGEVGRVEGAEMGLPEAEQMARGLLLARARDLGIEEYADEAEITHAEVFNMVRGWSRVGRLLDVKVEIPAGILASWEGAPDG